VENLSAAIEAVLATQETLRRPFIVADAQALTVAEMIAAMRHGLGRWPNVFWFPAMFLEYSFRAAGRQHVYERLSGSLVVDPSALMRMGWTPPLTTEVGLARLMQAPAGVTS
jgi:UDP-glucose 4-epimerase